MTLMELLVGLSILGLAMGFALATLGPSLVESRRADREAAFWRSVEPAQLILSELAAGVIDPKDTLRVESDRARLRVFAPRLSAVPFDAELAIAPDREDRAALIIRTPALEQKEGVLLGDAPPLRFRVPRNGRSIDSLVLEARTRHTWEPLLVAPIAVDAPLKCEFDFIARACR